MEWRDEGIIIGGRRFGETSLIVEVMTRGHGRHPGMVRGGRGKRMLPLLQVGNLVEVTWRARLEDHLGVYAVETTKLRAAELMEAPESLHGLNLLAALLRLLAEREPHEDLYEMATEALAALDMPEVGPASLVRFELALLAGCGFGLDLDRCVATGGRDELVYVSPKSGCAVSRGAGEPYKDKLLPLPAFLIGDGEPPCPSDLAAAFRLTGYFLERDLFAPRGLKCPESRDAYLARLKRSSPVRENVPEPIEV